MSRPLVALSLTLTALAAPLLGAGAAVAQAAAPARTLETSGSTFNISAVQALLAKGDAAAAAGNLAQANTAYDQARDICRKLITWYVGLAGSFRGLDARIPREMDAKGREVLELQVKTNLRLAAVYRRMNQPEIAVPLLVEVVTTAGEILHGHRGVGQGRDDRGLDLIGMNHGRNGWWRVRGL